MAESSTSSGAKNARRAFEFGKTHVIEPKGRHQATIVWLHGLHDKGLSWVHLLKTIPLPNIKWICPTAPSQPITVCRGLITTAWCDVSALSEDANEDLEGLDATATHVASLLSAEPPGIKLGIGGFCIGAAAALYSATCFVHGKFGTGNPYPATLSVVVGLSGWMPYLKSLSNKVEGEEAAQRATSLPILICHGRGDYVVRFNSGKKSSRKLISCGFQDCMFKTYTGLGHYILSEELEEVGAWLSLKLSLDGPQS